MYATRLTSTSGSTPTEDIRSVVRTARVRFEGGQISGMTWRLRQLEGLIRLLDERGEAALRAVRDDTGRPREETHQHELAAVRRVAEYARRSLAGWMKSERRGTPLLLQPSLASVQREAVGVVVFITPWCEPLRTPLTALVGALAGGNAVIVKPSEQAPATSAFLARQLPDYLDPEAVAVVEGGAPEAEALIAEPIDQLFFAGRRDTARSVMRAAAEQLVPVTLSVGGKNPCFVDRSADLATAARRIVWGKFLACGQSCLAPDYVLVHEAVEEALVAHLAEAMLDRFGEDPRSHIEYGRIASVPNLNRLERLLRGRGRVVVGGVIDRAERYLAPTLIQGPGDEEPVMRDEVLGPILPVRSVSGVDEAIRHIRTHAEPLALYFFAHDASIEAEMLARTRSGSAVLNHVGLHAAAPALPLGAVGGSGFGALQGRDGFENFTYARSCLRKPSRFDPDLLLATPANATRRRLMQSLL